jgi:hypothetical protein
MAKKTKNVTLAEEDIRLLSTLKKAFFPTHGTLSNVAVVRMGLRNLEQAQKEV